MRNCQAFDIGNTLESLSVCINTRQLIYGCRVFNNYKNSNYKKQEGINKNSKYFFVKFQTPFFSGDY